MGNNSIFPQHWHDFLKRNVNTDFSVQNVKDRSYKPQLSL
jgi:hypothetical protein